MKDKILEIMNRSDYRPMRYKDFQYLFAAHKPKDKDALKAVLSELVEQGTIRLNENNRYDKAIKDHLKKGVYLAGKGNFGFVEVDDELFEHDIFIPGSQTNLAYHNDVVLVEITKHAQEDKNPEGRIVEILERAPQVYVGVFHRNRNFGFVVVHDQRQDSDIFIPKKEFGKANHLDMVQVEVTKIPKMQYQKREGKILKVIGASRDPNIDIQALIYKHQLPTEFNPAAIREAKRYTEKKDYDLTNRKDLRNERIFTIDGKYAKDLDDAVGVQRTEQGYSLTVSIADVSYYVTTGSSLDQDAFERGTSVYFPDQVIPMLPRELSEDLCSLNPNEDKLTFTCEVHIDQNGKIYHSECYKSIISSKARFVYDDVNLLLADETELLDKTYIDYRDDLILMDELAQKLLDRRMQQGSIDLDMAEPLIEVDEKGRAVNVLARERGRAERIIEDLMLTANRCVAHYIFHTGIPSLYRVHEEPDSEKLAAFSKLASLLGHKIRFSQQHYSGQLNQFIRKIEDTDEEFVLKKMLLRSLKKAEYRSDDTSHFALGFQFYTHFTSPIRRYPDLMVHRILTHIVEGTLSEELIEELNEDIKDIAKHCSKTERRAEEAQRDAEKIKIAQYMVHQRGVIYRGVINSIVNFGFFVELSNLAEGLVRFSDIQDDYYHVDLERLRAYGRDTKRELRVGDLVFVEVYQVNVHNGEIDLLLLNDDEVVISEDQ